MTAKLPMTLTYSEPCSARRRCAIGATTEDLYDVARLLRANAIFEALHVVDEGVDEYLDPPWSVRVGNEKLIQLHGEFWYVVDLGRK